MKILILKLALLGIFLVFFDHISTWYMVNHLDIGIFEGNPNFRTEQGKLDMDASTISLWVVLSIYILMALLLLKDGVFPTHRNYASFQEFEKKHRRLAFALFPFIMVVINQGVIVFLWNPMSDLGLTKPFYFDHFKYTFLFLSAIFSAYWGTAIFWRYLNPDARAKYPYLAWPYEKGLMRDVI